MFHLIPTLVLGFAPPVDDSPASALERAFTTLESLGYSGGLAVVEDGETIVLRGFGYSDRATGARITADSIFDCGSITKQFTAAAILALEADGKLAVEDPITEYFAAVPADKHGITIHHLLTHSAGLPGAIGVDTEAIDGADYLERALATPLASEPGTRFEYSNVGFSLLGLIVEEVAGKPYERFLRERLFTPAGIETAGYVLPRFELSAVAKIYDGDTEWGRVFQRSWLPDGPGWHLRGNGGIHLRLADMLRWVAAIQDDTVLPAAQREKMFKQQIDEGGGDSFYGYGWTIERGPRGKIIHHNGGNLVFSANVRFIPAIERCVFVVSTQKDFNADDLMELAIGILNGDDEAHLPAVIPLPREELAALGGDYANDAGHHMTVTVRGPLVRLTPSDAASDGLLFDRDSEARAEHAALAARVEAILKAAVAGDYGPLQAAAGKRRSLEETGARFRELFDQAIAAHGAFSAVRALAVRPFREATAVWLELTFERGRESTAYVFDGDLLIGQLISERGLTVDLAPVGDLAFQTFSLRSDDPPLQVRFAASADGTRKLVLPDGTELVRVK